MGTNYYWRVPDLTLPTGERAPLDRDDPIIHIGKRSSAGLYCWDCDLTLCKAGMAGIHHSDIRPGESYADERKRRWHERCPTCDQPPAPINGLTEGPAAVELGFAKAPTTRPSGVRGAASFSWAQDPEAVGAICEQRADEPIIEDEYGDPLTGREFLAMIRSNCPIQFTEMIGLEFS